MNNINQIYRIPKEKCIQLLNQVNSKIILTLRDQIFYIFIDHFDKNTLVQNGSLITDSDLKHHLKRKLKTINAYSDIYHMGLRILENNIVHKLSADILKPTHEDILPTSIINSHSSLMLEKLQAGLETNKVILNENKEKKQHILILESKIELISKSLQKKSDTKDP